MIRFLTMKGLSGIRRRSALFHQSDQLRPTLQYPIIPLWDMGKKAVGAVFDPGGGIGELSAASVIQNVEGTVAKHAIELFRIGVRMAGEVFAVAVAEETMVMLHSMLLFKIDKLPPVLGGSLSAMG